MLWPNHQVRAQIRSENLIFWAFSEYMNFITLPHGWQKGLLSAFKAFFPLFNCVNFFARGFSAKLMNVTEFGKWGNYHTKINISLMPENWIKVEINCNIWTQSFDTRLIKCFQQSWSKKAFFSLLNIKTNISLISWKNGWKKCENMWWADLWSKKVFKKYIERFL